MRLIWPWQDRNRRFSLLKAVTFGLMLLPATRFGYHVATGEYGSLAMAYGGMTYWSGVWATAMLLFALAITPAAKVLGWYALVDVRRMIGVTGLAYTVGHLIIYFGLRVWNFPVIATEVVTRGTLIAAAVSTVGLIVLGVTSVDAAIKSMGSRNWQRLHNANYLITGLAVLHVVLARGTYTEQYVLTGVFVWLMAWRVLDRYRKGTDVAALALLSLGMAVFTGLLEAFSFWVRRGYEMSWTLGNNFSLSALENLGISPGWQVFGFGFAFTLGAAARHALRGRSARVEARQAA